MESESEDEERAGCDSGSESEEREESEERDENSLVSKPVEIRAGRKIRPPKDPPLYCVNLIPILFLFLSVAEQPTNNLMARPCYRKKKVPCDACGMVLKNQCTLRRHQRRRHGAPGKNGPAPRPCRSRW